jgi:hypothetical protein
MGNNNTTPTEFQTRRCLKLNSDSHNYATILMYISIGVTLLSGLTSMMIEAPDGEVECEEGRDGEWDNYAEICMSYSGEDTPAWLFIIGSAAFSFSVLIFLHSISSKLQESSNDEEK